MKINIKSYYLGFALALCIFMMSCQQPGPNNPGSEYMPDMAHAVSYEANYYTYYSHNTWGTEEEYHEMHQPRVPVIGSIPRDLKNRQRSASVSGTIPYAYIDTEDSRNEATANLINNPYPITTDGLARGKDLYVTFCAICHGEKGDGAGYLVRDANPATGDEGGKYPVQPAILTNDEFSSTSNGRLYHAIVYGKNLMGSYADKMNSEERWQVVHYIRALQAKNKNLAYSQIENTFTSVDIPAGIDYIVQASSYDASKKHSEDGHIEKEDEHHMDAHEQVGEHHSDDHHSHDDHQDHSHNQETHKH